MDDVGLGDKQKYTEKIVGKKKTNNNNKPKTKKNQTTKLEDVIPATTSRSKMTPGHGNLPWLGLCLFKDEIFCSVICVLLSRKEGLLIPNVIYQMS